MHLMRLTAFSDYSLRVLIYVAAAPEGKATIGEVARAFGVSEHHLVKVVHALGRHGILENKRGRFGGMRLARPAPEISVGAVLRLTEGQAMPAECFDRRTNTCPLSGACRLERALCGAVEAFYASLDDLTLDDLRVGPRALKRLVAAAARSAA